MLEQVPLPPYRAETFNVLQIRFSPVLSGDPEPGSPMYNPYYMIEAEGIIRLGPSPAYGSVRVVGMTVEEIKEAVSKQLQKTLRNPEVSVQLARVAGSSRSPVSTSWAPTAR